jgi:glycosyltransferase involved in cell wall biosynthesis
VTYEGVDKMGVSNNSKESLLKKYKLTKPYFIFTGNAYPHKNLDRLIEATVFLNEQHGVSAMLGISSSRSVFTERLEKMIEKHNAQKYIKLLGFVPDDELGVLYSASVAFVYPSLMEGFGLPGLEAMQAGTLALVSSIPVFKEIYADAAVYFNPHDFTAISRTMKDALTMNKEKRVTILSKGKKHARQYDWKKMAEETLKVYEDSVSL